MDQKDYQISTNKCQITILTILILAVSLGLLAAICISPRAPKPDTLTEITCSFQSYEIKRHTKSISYDLLLTSEEYDLPFKFAFFDGYKKQISPDELCTGIEYSLLVLPSETNYIIYKLSDPNDNFTLTKEEAYSKSQRIAFILLVVFLIITISYYILFLLIVHFPDRFNDKIKRLFFKPRKSL